MSAEFDEIATFASLMGERFQRAGMATPRVVVSPKDADRLLNMVPIDRIALYVGRGEPDPSGAFLTINGVRFYRAKERT